MGTLAKPLPVLRFGMFEADRRVNELRRNGIHIRLQQQPFQILLILLDHAGEPVSREELRRELWPADTIVDFDRNLNKAMNKLRQALGDSADNPRFVETLPRKGYRFIAPVTMAHGESPTAIDTEPSSIGVGRELPISEPELSISRSEPSAAALTGLRFPARPSGLWKAGGVVLLLLLCAVALIYRQVRSPRKAPSAPVTPRRSVAVLGFRNLSARPDDAWLATALSDWLTTDLSSGDQLRTISSENVVRAERELYLAPVDSLSRDSLFRIGRILGSDYIVAGAYGLVGNDSDRRLRLDLRLQDARTGDTLATVSETGTEADLFNLVSGAGERLRASLGIGRLTREETSQIAVALPRNHDAARLYSQGEDALHIFDALTAGDLLRQSIAIEPDYSLSHAALATVWEELGYDDRARAEAKTALDLSSKLPRPERLLVEGRYDEMSKQWNRAINVYRALFEFFPDSLDYGLALAHAQLGGGDGVAALATVAQLRKLPVPLGDDPRLDRAEDCAAESLGDYNRDFVAAGKAADKARSLGASLLLAQALADQAWALQNLGRPDEAVAAAEQSKQIFAQAGDKRGEGLETNTIGIVLLDGGNAAGAKDRFEETLKIYQQLHSSMGIAGDLDDLGDSLIALGDLNASRRSYEQSLATYQEIDHQDGVALAQSSIGILLLAEGEPQQATKNLKEALEICLRLGDRSKASTVMVNIAEALRIQGDYAGAKKYEAQALQGFRAIGNGPGVASVELSTAKLLMDEHHPAQAESEAHEAFLEFRREKEADQEAVAGATLAQSLLDQGRTGEAQKTIQDAESALIRCDYVEAKLQVEIVSALVDAASQDALVRERATNSLNQVLTQADKSGFVTSEFEARFALAELELQAGARSAAQGRLEALRRDALARDCEGITRRVDAARQKNDLMPRRS